MRGLHHIVAITPSIGNGGIQCRSQEVADGGALSQSAKCAYDSVRTIVVDDRVLIAVGGCIAVPGRRAEHHIRANGHRTAHVELVVSAVGISGCCAANLDAKGVVVGKNEVACNVQDSGRLPRRNVAVERDRGGGDIRARMVVNHATSDSHWVQECRRVDIDNAGSAGRIADGKRTETVGQRSEFGISETKIARGTTDANGRIGRFGLDDQRP